MKIPVSSEMLSANQENQVVDNLALFEKVLAFWINLVWIFTKIVRWIAVVGEFSAFELVFALFLASG
jgi:hypothetical protein